MLRRSLAIQLRSVFVVFRVFNRLSPKTLERLDAPGPPPWNPLDPLDTPGVFSFSRYTVLELFGTSPGPPGTASLDNPGPPGPPAPSNPGFAEC